MEELAAVIDKIQEVTSVSGHELSTLPQIVVIGDQSSGKSSILESLVGHSFLPTGMGIVTRCPLILQLVRKSEDESKDSVNCGIFLHNKERIYSNFNDICNEIVAETIRKAGNNKGINTEPIILKIFSSKASTLTMVDLPGIVKVPVGDQPSDVENVVKSLILKYISNGNAIILAIVAANTDIASSESLKIAKQVDPEFDRTIAVVTKLDLMDAGTDATEILTGKLISLKLGIIGVVNRSHLHTKEGKRISDAVKDEAHYLKCMYPSISHKHGIPSLARTLHKILLRRIDNCLPLIRNRIKTSISHYEQLLSSYGDAFDDPKKLLLEFLTKYSTTYCNKILGTHSDLETKELTGGARMSYIFVETYGRALEAIDPLEGLNRAALVTAMRNTSGVRPLFIISQTCFELLVKQQIERLEAPSLACVQLIHDELERIANNVSPSMNISINQFPTICTKIKSIISRLVDIRVNRTNDMVKSLVRIHTSYINTNHPDFIKDKFEVLTGLKNGSGYQSTEQSMPHHQMSLKAVDNGPFQSETPKECVLVEALLTSYFKIVMRSIQDSVPKAIMHFLVNDLVDCLLSQLVSQLYNNEMAQILAQEFDKVSEQRRQVQTVLQSYKKADLIIGEIRESYYQ